MAKYKIYYASHNWCKSNFKAATQFSVGLKHSVDSPTAHARKSLIGLHLGIIPILYRSLQALHKIIIVVNSPVSRQEPLEVDIGLNMVFVMKMKTRLS